MLKNILTITLLFVLSCANLPYWDRVEIVLNKNYPQWIRLADKHSDQTSGISFVGAEGNSKTFLIVDDIGSIHRISYINDKLSGFTTYKFSEKVTKYLAKFPKKDFEEISFDSYTGEVYLSIEGNFPDFRKSTKIVKVKFKNNSIFSNMIIDFEELNITPAETFEKYLDNNVAYEGMTVDKNYIYLGLEGFQSGVFFADSTYIYVVDKKTLKIIKEISTKQYKIGTICGLQIHNGDLWGVDRNGFNVFRMRLNEKMDVVDIQKFDFKSRIPGTEDLSYISAIESITFDNENNIYLVDDPWKRFYIPGESVLSKLSEETVKNFKSYIPIIYKYNLINQN